MNFKLNYLQKDDLVLYLYRGTEKMKKLEELKKHLRSGEVYRRADLAQWSNAVDRHLVMLLKEGLLEKVSAGLYYVPKETVFGVAPPDEKVLVRTFLKDDNFLLTSPNAYNSLGVGTTQLYNKRIVYNHKRHGEFNLGGKEFFFHSKHHFPKKLTPEFLLVDLVNNIDTLAEDKEVLLKNVFAKVTSMDRKQLKRSLDSYGNVKTKSLLSPVLNEQNQIAHAV
ncbi:hypothetical protein [Chitinophaga sp. HK235]|uniref:hypothetical protein n=1 Tax=Chitinophaga sp. HK235 TaxID=2952571 RepID=UPI0020115BA9|nr:hypothetical protein [Chitinophaga sp. HK235]